MYSLLLWLWLSYTPIFYYYQYIYRYLLLLLYMQIFIIIITTSMYLLFILLYWYLINPVKIHLLSLLLYTPNPKNYCNKGLLLPMYLAFMWYSAQGNDIFFSYRRFQFFNNIFLNNFGAISFTFSDLVAKIVAVHCWSVVIWNQIFPLPISEIPVKIHYYFDDL